MTRSGEADEREAARACVVANEQRQSNCGWEQTHTQSSKRVVYTHSSPWLHGKSSGRSDHVVGHDARAHLVLPPSEFSFCGKSKKNEVEMSPLSQAGIASSPGTVSTP